jgi:rubrerythrin
LTVNVLQEIADEERVHAGEFLKLLTDLAPDEKKFYEEGAEEVQEMIDKLKKPDG